jgi:Tfp pilus assembly protein PilF
LRKFKLDGSISSPSVNVKRIFEPGLISRNTLFADVCSLEGRFNLFLNTEILRDQKIPKADSRTPKAKRLKGQSVPPALSNMNLAGRMKLYRRPYHPFRMYSLRTLSPVITLALVSFAVPAQAQHADASSQSKHSDSGSSHSKHSDSALSQSKSSDSVPNQSAHLRAVRKEHQLAVSNYKGDPWRKVKLLPQNRTALYKASGLMRLERYDDAIKILTIAMARDPKEYHLTALRAEIYSITQQYPKAIGDYNTLIASAPNSNETAYAFRGKIYERLGDDKTAVSDYSKSISLGGHFHDIRARVYMRHGQWQEALNDWTSAIKYADAETIMSMYTDRARCYDKLGKPALAEKDRSKANEVLNDLVGSNVDTYPDLVTKTKAK